MASVNSCHVMNTPPETPRVNARARKQFTVDSPGEGNFTPAKIDDISRVSSLKLPLDKLRTPVLSVRQPEITQIGLTTPPYAKRRKSSGSIDKFRSKVASPLRADCDQVEAGGSSTPRNLNRTLSAERVPPGAPRKARRENRSGSQISVDACEGRKLDFGSDDRPIGPTVLTSPDVDWDDILAEIRSENPPKRDREVLRAMRMMAGRLETMPGNSFSMSEFRNLLRPAFPETDSVISKLEREHIILVNRASGTISLKPA